MTSQGSSRLSTGGGYRGLWDVVSPAAEAGVGFPKRRRADVLIARSSSIFTPPFPFFLVKKVNTRGRFEPLIHALYSKENNP